jgi:hypothetical protein
MPLVLAVCCIASAGPREKGHMVSAELKSVLVYRNSAELLHSVKADVTPGSSELIIEGLSPSLDEHSLRVSCNQSVNILGVRFFNDPIKPESHSSQWSRWQDSIIRLGQDSDKMEIQLRTDRDLLALLQANREIRGIQTGLSVTELAKMMTYYREKSIELQNEIASAESKKNLDGEISEKLRREQRDDDLRNTRTTGRVILQLQSEKEVETEFSISYLTASAHWDPGYELQLDQMSDSLRLLYRAVLVQQCGMDWKSVQLSLSTGIPDQEGNAPELTTWILGLAEPLGLMRRAVTGSASGVALNDVVVRGYGSEKLKEVQKPIPEDKENQAIILLNGRRISQEEFNHLDPSKIRRITNLSGPDAEALYGSRGANGAVIITAEDALGDHVSVNDQAVNMTYSIDLPYDVPGNGKPLQVDLTDYRIPATYSYYSAPKADENAYLLAAVPNWDKLGLLAGEAVIRLEGSYAGKTWIDPHLVGDTLHLTLSRDKRVVVKRVKLGDFSSTSFLGATRKLQLSYAISVRNGRKDTVKIALKDQYPISSNKEVETELIESDGATVNAETGLLTWNLRLKPGEIKTLRISYSVKYPKDQLLSGW